MTPLNREIALLYKCESAYKLPAAPVTRQLLTESERPLPDVLPKPPRWVDFEWPPSGSVNLTAYWLAVDRRVKERWTGEYL